MRPVVAGAIALGVLGAVIAGAGRLQPPQPGPFRSEANYVRVDVSPTKDEAAAGDLTAADFEIRDNNTPQRIEEFEHVVVRGNVPRELRAEATPSPSRGARSRSADRGQPDRSAFLL